MHQKNNDKRGRKPAGRKNSRQTGQAGSRPPVKNAAFSKKAVKKRQVEKETFHDEEKPVRLNKYLANAGICSRREADELIKTGLVEVNGKLITELGVKVNPGDAVKFNGQLLKKERKVYVLLNKPKDYITTVDDPFAKKTVMDIVGKACKERIYPVGRLDRGTTGVLLLTNDGDLTKKLLHPKYNKKKIYHVWLDRSLSRGDMMQLTEGVQLEDGLASVDEIHYVEDGNKREVGVEIHSGKNRIIRRIFESIGYKVVKLDRVFFCGLTKKNLPRGKWRFLYDKEIAMLKMGAYQ